MLRIVRAFTKPVFGNVDILQAGELEVPLTEIQMLRPIGSLRDMDVLPCLEYTQADDRMTIRRRAAVIPLTGLFYFAFHVMGWSASKI